MLNNPKSYATFTPHPMMAISIPSKQNYIEENFFSYKNRHLISSMNTDLWNFFKIKLGQPIHHKQCFSTQRFLHKKNIYNIRF